MAEKPHALTLFLDAPLCVALTQFQALNTLGRTYAGLLIFIEGLRKLNLVNEVVYQHYKGLYSQPLRITPIVEDPQVAKRNEAELQRARKSLQGVIELFPKLNAKSQAYWRQYALDRPDIPESTELLRKYCSRGTKT
jgi:hypothetical protein